MKIVTNSGLRLVWLAALFGVAACASAPEISIPQLEGARRMVEEPREERAHLYQECLHQALPPPPGSQEALLRCMRERGYAFLADTAPHRIQHCLEMRNAEGRFPDDFCFQKVK